MQGWHSGYCVRLQSGYSWVRVPPPAFMTYKKKEVEIIGFDNSKKPYFFTICGIKDGRNFEVLVQRILMFGEISHYRLCHLTWENEQPIPLQRRLTDPGWMYIWLTSPIRKRMYEAYPEDKAKINVAKSNHARGIKKISLEASIF